MITLPMRGMSIDKLVVKNFAQKDIYKKTRT